MASPQFGINGGGLGIKAEVAASGAIVATLGSTVGIKNVEWWVANTDETTDADDYTLVPSGSHGETVSFNAGAAATAGELKCRINWGRDLATDQVDLGVTEFSCKWWVPVGGSAGEVFVFGELGEASFLSSPTHGLIAGLNTLVRDGFGAGSDYINKVTSPTDNAICRFDGAGGVLIQNSIVTLSDTGAMLWGSTATTPTLSQTTKAGAAVHMSITAQSSSDNTGGNLTLSAGGGNGAAGGDLSLVGGSGDTYSPSSVVMSGAGGSVTVAGSDSDAGPGGNIILAGGNGSTADNDGYVEIRSNTNKTLKARETGGQTQIEVGRSGVPAFLNGPAAGVSFQANGQTGITLTEAGGVPKLGLFSVTPVIRQTGGFTSSNDISSGGSQGVFADFTSLTVYATDAATIRNNQYRQGEMIKLLWDAARAYGLLT